MSPTTILRSAVSSQQGFPFRCQAHTGRTNQGQIWIWILIGRNALSLVMVDVKIVSSAIRVIRYLVSLTIHLDSFLPYVLPLVTIKRFYSDARDSVLSGEALGRSSGCKSELTPFSFRPKPTSLEGDRQLWTKGIFEIRRDLD